MYDTHYAVLGIGENATADEIRQAHRRLAHQLHPDRTGDDPVKTEAFKRVQRAYETLTDPVRRGEYDRRRREPNPAATHRATSGAAWPDDAYRVPPVDLRDFGEAASLSPAEQQRARARQIMNRLKHGIVLAIALWCTILLVRQWLAQRTSPHTQSVQQLSP